MKFVAHVNKQAVNIVYQSGGDKENRERVILAYHKRAGKDSDSTDLFSQHIHFVNTYFILATDYYISAWSSNEL